MEVVKEIAQHLAQEPPHQHVAVRVQAPHLQIAETAAPEVVLVVAVQLVQETVQVVVVLTVAEAAIQHVIPLVPVLVAVGVPPIVREVVPELPKLLAVLVRLLATLLAPHNV